MRREHVILVAGAIAVSGLAVYLFVAVNAVPAQAQTQHAPVVAKAPVPPSEEDREPVVRPSTPGVKPITTAKDDPEEPSLEPSRPRKLGMKGLGEVRSKALGVERDPDRANPKMDAVMDEANRAYDTGEMDDAKQIALKVLAADPTNIRMLRIAVSTSCIDGDNTEAQKHFAQLPTTDREQMKIRCARYGITFTDAPVTDESTSTRKMR